MALAGLSVSKDGSKAAIGIAAAGSDWAEWKVVDVATGPRPGTACAGSSSPSPPSPRTAGPLLRALRRAAVRPRARRRPEEPEGLLPQARDSAGNRHARPLARGPLAPEPGARLGGRALARRLDLARVGGKNNLWLRDLSVPGADWIRLANDFSARWTWVDGDGTTRTCARTRTRPRPARVRRPRRRAPVFRDVIPQGPDTLAGVDAVGGRFVAVTLHDAAHRVRLYGRDGTPGPEIPLPALGAVGGFRGRRGDPDTYFGFASFTYPGSVYRLDLATGKTTLWKQPKVDFDPAAFETTQVFYTSKDGTKVPVFLVSKKGAKRDGTAPALLTGYGGFNIAELPSFSVRTPAFVERGGTFALAILRGGSEYGEDWHRGECSATSRMSSTISRRPASG